MPIVAYYVYASYPMNVTHTHTNKYLFLKELALLWGQSIGFCNERDDVDFVMESLHELNVQRFQTEGETQRKHKNKN